MDSLLRTDNEAAETYEKYVNPIYRICFSFMKNPADAEDMVRETFIKLIIKSLNSIPNNIKRRVAYRHLVKSLQGRS